MFKREGIGHRGSYSFLINRILEAAFDSYDCTAFDTTEEALAYLQEEGFSINQLGTKKGKGLLRAMNKDALHQAEMDLEDPVDEERAADIRAMLEEDDGFAEP